MDGITNRDNDVIGLSATLVTQPAAVPEPGGTAMLTLTGAGLAAWMRFRRRSVR